MFIGMPTCTFKCELEAGCKMCQNKELAQTQSIEIDDEVLLQRYLNNHITSAVVFGGLEPLDSPDMVLRFVSLLRQHTNDDVVIFTGYTEEEVYHNFADLVDQLSQYKNIIVKFGRFVPNQDKHFDETLGVFLYGENQYAKIIS